MPHKPATLRAFILRLIASKQQSDVGERRWDAERLARLLREYDEARRS